MRNRSTGHWSTVMSAQTKLEAWERFAMLYNSTGTHMLNDGQGHRGCVNECALAWMHDQLFNTSYETSALT
eukprot:SAG31_NODE_12278_length_953_cov_0.932084_1_plen_71_part_00